MNGRGGGVENYPLKNLGRDEGTPLEREKIENPDFKKKKKLFFFSLADPSVALWKSCLTLGLEYIFTLGVDLWTLL